MSNIYIKAEIMVRTSIEDAIKEAKEKALALDVCFSFDFNGVEMFVSKDTDMEEEIYRYRRNKEQIDKLQAQRLMINLLTT